MSEERHPVVMCDGDDGMCQVVEFDHTLGGLGQLVGSETQLPRGWSGDKPGARGEHFCPECTATPTPSCSEATGACGTATTALSSPSSEASRS